MRASPFSFKASGMARLAEPEKFVRPDLSKTEILCYGLARWKGTITQTTHYQLITR